jgi:hypothetical protein
MKLVLRILALGMVCLGSADAFAQAPKPAHSPSSKVPAQGSGAAGVANPAPGTCSYIQPGVKVCTTIDGQGAFDVVTFPPAAAYIRFEEPILEATAPDERFFQHEISREAPQVMSIAPLRKDLPERMPIVVRTEHLTVTINLRPGSLAKADTQITIRDPKRSEREVAVAKAVAEAQKRLEPLANERARAVILEELALHGGDIRKTTGTTRTRNGEGLVVLRVKDVVRIGRKRFVLVSVQNLSSENFEVRGLRLWLDGHQVPAAWKLARMTIAPNDEPSGAIELPEQQGPTSVPARARVLVEEADGRRNIDLTGLVVP